MEPNPLQSSPPAIWSPPPPSIGDDRHARLTLPVRASVSQGRTWSPARIAVDGSLIGARGSATVGNPTAVYDEETRTIWLLLCTNQSKSMAIEPLCFCSLICTEN